ncbi:uncharacterized protein [Drosophila bipectinata]|uniref:uncharacterized protein n=1 Tax=Drosophila bipectinata TaxID=42026 RepID=UPI001C8A04D8|nr:uncharacterized protein LOC108126567 [Drosophila bipectinata]
MSKSQKVPAKLKRGKRHTRNQAHNTKSDAAVEKEVENSRKAVERQLIYLSESNRAPAPTRPSRRSAAGRIGGGGGGGGAGAPLSVAGNEPSNVGTGHRRKHKKQHHQPAVSLPMRDETPSPKEKPKSKARTPYNVFMESPRRNGLTPRDPVAEAELAAYMAAQRTGTGSSKVRRLQEHLLQEDGDGAEDEFGRLDLNENLGNYPPAEPQPTYTCGVCGAKFHIRSLLGAHRRTHDDDFKVRFRSRRRPRDSNTTLTAGSQCKFCDRRFDLERTLHIHQLCHCKKIPPQQRRKLAYTELAHEKKAPLPSFRRHSHSHTRTQGLGGGHHSQRSAGGGASMPAMQHPLMQQHDLEKTVLSNSAVHERWR